MFAHSSWRRWCLAQTASAEELASTITPRSPVKRPSAPAAILTSASRATSAGDPATAAGSPLLVTLPAGSAAPSIAHSGRHF